jgi:GAF domain-containing protein
MDLERLLRDVEKHLEGRDEALVAELQDAVREAVARQRRRLDPALTVETERERRLEAETLREVLEAVQRHGRLDETAREILKQASRLAIFDSCVLALLEGDGTWHVLAVRGFPEPARAVGLRRADPLFDAVRDSELQLSVPEVAADPRYQPLPGGPETASWAGLPLRMEGLSVGLIGLGRERVEPFDDEELHRVRALAFSAAAALRHAQTLEQVKRYATLMEAVVAVDQLAFRGAREAELAAAILEGAHAIGNYRGGLLVAKAARGARIVAAAGEGLEGLTGRAAPAELLVSATSRLPREACEALAARLGSPLPTRFLCLIPLVAETNHAATVVLLDPDEETPDDRLMESYASRAAPAWLFARQKGR